MSRRRYPTELVYQLLSALPDVDVYPVVVPEGKLGDNDIIVYRRAGGDLRPDGFSTKINRLTVQVEIFCDTYDNLLDLEYEVRGLLTADKRISIASATADGWADTLKRFACTFEVAVRK